MRTLCWWSLVGAATLALMGCGGNSAVTPAGQNLDPNFDATYDEHGLRASVAGAYRIDIDVATMSATVTPISRQGNAIGDLFYLNVDQFGVVVAPNPNGTLTNLDLVNNTIDFNYLVKHSFASPSNPGGSATAANRADLGVSGRVLFLLDAPGAGDDYVFAFGGGNVVLNSGGILNADGYYDPVAMIDGYHTATNGTNAWPFRQLVDESLDSRTNSATAAAISNGGSSAGNYAANRWGAVSEWTGGPNVTGYGVLHQGQTAGNHITLDISPGNSITLDAVVIANYSDPRGGANAAERRANRLPKGDPALFAYRMPHGALDLGSIGVSVAGTLGAAASSTVGATVTVVDMDNGAAVGTGLDETPVASGIASIEMVSGALGAQAAFGAPTGTGTPEDPLTYAVDITNDLGTASGTAIVCIRVVDEQDAANPLPGEGGITLNNASPPTPGPTAQSTRVYQVARVEIL